MSSEKDLGEWLLHELYFAYLDARRHKRNTYNEHTFEPNAMGNLMILRDDIMNHRFKPSRGEAFVINEPVVREIFAAPFRDRIVHHFIFNQVGDWWDRHFIYDSYSCREGKGTLFGIRRLQRHIRQVSRQGSREAYVLKFDIQGYFMSLSREKVYERVCWGLEKQFGESDYWLKNLINYLWREIIFDNPINNVRIKGSISDWDNLPENKSLFCQPPGKGIVIGNLTSQLISNIYLDQLDRFMVHNLGFKHYGRYVDDFFCIVSCEEFDKALSKITKINDFLHDLELTLHPKKIYIQNVQKGVPFLGVVVYPNSIAPGKRFKDHFYRALNKYSMGFIDDETIISYMGYLKHCDSKKFAKKIFDCVGFDFEF